MTDNAGYASRIIIDRADHDLAGKPRLRTRTGNIMNEMHLSPSINCQPASIARPAMSAGEGLAIVTLIALCVLILAWRWVGYQGHDDAYYAAAALEWVDHFPAIGTDHWALRYPLVLPIAACLALFGPHSAALALTNLGAYAAILTIQYGAVRHWFGRIAAVLVTLILIVVPQFPVQATYANPDLLEMAFVMGSFWMLMLARERSGGARSLLLAACGALAGFGFLTRETAVALGIVYGLMFLVRPAMSRWRYIVIGLGFATVVGAQMGYFAVRTGDPLYRMRISATHDSVDRMAKPREAAEQGRALDSEGVLAIDARLAPLAAVFISQKYGLLFLFAVPAYILLRVRRPPPLQRDVLDGLALCAVVAFLFVALSADLLYVVPRYFMVPAAAGAVMVAVLGAQWLVDGGMRRAWAWIFGAALVLTSLGLLYLENTTPMAAENQIISFAAASPAPVHVDPETLGRMSYLLLASHANAHVTSDPPGLGNLVGVKEGVVEACLRSPRCGFQDRMPPFLPHADWIEVSRSEPPRRAISGLLAMLGLERLIPTDILRKIEQPGLRAVLYRVPE